MKIEFVDEVTSTNDVLIAKGHAGLCEDTVLVAFRQTGGKGRNGRSFFSPAKSGLYMSFLLHPKVQMQEAFLLTPLVAVAAAKAVEEYANQQIDIKWVNDLYKNGKKISGILTECSSNIINGEPEFLVAGIGFNLFEPEGGFPNDIKDKAGSIFADDIDSLTNEALTSIKKGLAYSMVEQFEKYYEDFPYVTFLSEYRKRSFIVGKEVQILGGPKVKAIGIADDFGLIVEHLDGLKETLKAGEVSLVIGDSL